MKKIYIEPTLKMVKIGGQMLLEGSTYEGPDKSSERANEFDSKSFIGTVYDDEEDTGSDW